MTNDEFIDQIVAVYGQLLDVTMPYTTIDLLERVLASGSMFDMQVLSVSEGLQSKEALFLVRNEVDKQNLSDNDRRILEERLKRVLTEKIDKARNNKKAAEITNEITSKVIGVNDYAPLVEKLWEDKSADEVVMIAGLGVLIVETEHYLKHRGELYQEGVKAELFFEVLEEIKADEGENFENWFEQLKSSGVTPTGVVERIVTSPTGDIQRIVTSKGDDDDGYKSPLLEQSIISKPAINIGRTFLVKFKEKLRKNICIDKDGPWMRYKKGNIIRTTLPTAAVTTIFEQGLSANAVWVPIAVYIGLLIARAGLETYCED